MRRLLLEVKRRNLMAISSSIDLSPPKSTGKRQREVTNTKDEIASMAALRTIPLDPIPHGTTIPIPQILVPQGTRLPFPDSVPTFYGRFYEINRTSPYFKAQIRKAHIFHRCATRRNVGGLYGRARCHAPKNYHTLSIVDSDRKCREDTRFVQNTVPNLSITHNSGSRKWDFIFHRTARHKKIS